MYIPSSTSKNLISEQLKNMIYKAKLEGTTKISAYVLFSKTKNTTTSSQKITYRWSIYGKKADVDANNRKKFRNK